MRCLGHVSRVRRVHNMQEPPSKSLRTALVLAVYPNDARGDMFFFCFLLFFFVFFYFFCSRSIPTHRGIYTPVPLNWGGSPKLAKCPRITKITPVHHQIILNSNIINRTFIYTTMSEVVTLRERQISTFATFHKLLVGPS